MTILLSLAIVLAGMLAYTKIPISALPSYNTPVISVTAQLPGASPETMAASVALQLERQFAQIDGINVISSVNVLGTTQVILEFNNNRNIDAAAVDVQAALLRAQRLLPIELTVPPSYRKVNPADAPVLFLALTSKSMNLSELNDFAENLISPTISTISGVAIVNVNGQKKYAIRVRTKPDVMAARGLSMDDVVAAINQGNSNSPVGVLDGPRQTLTIVANKQLFRASEFEEIAIATRAGSVIKVKDVASVEESYESVKTAASYNGERSIVLTIQRQPNANTVQVVDDIKEVLPRLRAQLPASLEMNLMNDRSLSIREALHDVNLTLLLTVFLVVLVIALFLRRATATMIPTLSLPISLVGALSLHYWLGYSLNNISLLGITLAVGLVVDDAIVMLENIYRHVEEGMAPMTAALKGSREMSFTIMSISISLVAVFIPIFFMPGVIGLLFKEFAVIVSLAVLVSALVSLTLVPMLCSRFLKRNERKENVIGRLFERAFNGLLAGYTRTLDLGLRHKLIVLLIAASTFAATAWMFDTIPKGFFPEEDIGQIQGTIEAAEDISFSAMLVLQNQIVEILRQHPAIAAVASFNGTNVASAQSQNTGRMFITLKPRDQRLAMTPLMEDLRRRVRSVPGVVVFLRPIQNLQLGGRISKSRYQYILQSVSAGALNDWSDRIQQRMRADDIFRDVTSDSLLRGLQASLRIDRERAGVLGVSMQDVRSALYSTFGERQVSTIFTDANSYQVIIEADPEFRMFEESIGRLHVRARQNGTMVPLSSFVTVDRTVGPTSVNHAGQLQAITISFNLAPGVALGTATDKLERIRAELNPPQSIISSYGGDAAVFQGSQSSQVILIGLAVLVIYVLLGVLYESYIHPITILAGLPSAAVGALLALKLMNLDLTLIATIGILLLIGIVKKNAIMMVDFALDAQRHQGMEPAQAIRQACILRFRPIMMTTMAALMGALPIALGVGAGAELRQPLGVAVVGGLIFSQLITLYITPVIYLYLDRISGKGPVQLSAAQLAG